MGPHTHLTDHNPNSFILKMQQLLHQDQKSPLQHTFSHQTSRIIKGCYHWINSTHWVSKQPYHIGCWGEKGINIILQHILRVIKIKCSPLNHNGSADLILCTPSSVNRAAKSQVLKHLIQAQMEQRTSTLYLLPILSDRYKGTSLQRGYQL